MRVCRAYVERACCTRPCRWLSDSPSSTSSSVVQNTGSTARDHLANERTFLAWARTGLTFVGLGVGVDSLIRVSAPAKDEAQTNGERWKQHVPATLCVATGGLLLTYATQRYYRVQQCLENGKFPINKIGVRSVVATTSLLTLSTLLLTISDDIIDTSTWAPVPKQTETPAPTSPPPPPPARPPKPG